ncbi:MAG: surface-adhesin E family protein [bacterium]
MKKILYSFSLLICILTQYRVLSETYWAKIDETKTEKWYIDLESIEKDANYIDYWTKLEYKKPKNKTKYIYTHNVSECYRNLISITEMVRYNSNNSLIEHQSSRNMVQFTPIIPGSSLMKIHNLACKSATFKY